MDNNERAQSSCIVPSGLGSKKLHQIFRQQTILTVIQYIISTFVFLLGLYFYNFTNNMKLTIGSVTIKDVNIKNLNINMGTILILASLYMFVKITLDLNIKLDKGEK